MDFDDHITIGHHWQLHPRVDNGIQTVLITCSLDQLVIYHHWGRWWIDKSFTIVLCRNAALHLGVGSQSIDTFCSFPLADGDLESIFELLAVKFYFPNFGLRVHVVLIVKSQKFVIGICLEFTDLLLLFWHSFIDLLFGVVLTVLKIKHVLLEFVEVNEIVEGVHGIRVSLDI